MEKDKIKGLYIHSWGFGGWNEEFDFEIANWVSLVYGNPLLEIFGSWEPVKPVEKEFELQWSFPVNESKFAYVRRIRPDDHSISTKYVPFEHTDASNYIFEVLLDRWQEDWERYGRELEAALKVGWQKLGITEEMADALWEYDNKHGTSRYNNEAYHPGVKACGTVPEPLLVRVDGLKSILDRLPDPSITCSF